MILDNSLLNIGDRIEIRRIGSKHNIKYISQILEIIDEKTYFISGPIRKSNIIPISTESTIEITYCKEEKGRFLFNAIVLEREEKELYKLKIKKVGKTIRFQQRDFYRLSLNLNFIKLFSFMDGNSEKKIQENCIMKDISGGGIKFLCNFQHNIKDIINIKLNVNDSEVSFYGEIVRIKKSDDFDYNYEVGIKFINLRDADRDLLIRFIFDQQRKLRRKELM